MWGFHLIIDVGGCDAEKMDSKENIKECIAEMVEKSKMHALGETIFEYFEPTQEAIEKKIDGYTAIQVISTSSIVMHFVNSERAIFVDFFSCKDFNARDIEEIVVKYFSAKMTRTRFLCRDIVREDDNV